jgi:hypothetical protein
MIIREGNCHRKIAQIHLTSGQGSVSRHFEYSISPLRRGNSHGKAFAGQRILALATMVFSVLVFLIGADRTDLPFEALLARTHPVAGEQKGDST